MIRKKLAPHQNAPDFSQRMKVVPNAKRSMRDSALWWNTVAKGATDFSRWGSTIILILSILTSGCLSAEEKKAFVVKQVIDGDTIVLWTGEKVRYLGIDTPETTRREKGKWIFDPEPFGIEAKNFNKNLVEGKEVFLEFDIEKQDKYGRLLAYVRTREGIMVNQELLKNGLAVTLFIPPNKKYLDEFKKTEDSARRAHRGLWGK